jgi:sterol desaturase/sphingolipid hydroxylase (fatty acid hydroxylase superfamily)
VFSYKTWLIGLLPALLLERFRPVFRSEKIISKHLLMDAVYPLFRAIFGVLVVAAVLTTIAEAYKTYLPFLNTGLLDGKPLWVQGLGVFLITDLMFYVSHRLLHEVRWLWYFHAIHHSQTHLNPLTTHRGHPAESVIKTIIRTVPIGFVGGEPTTWVVFLVLNNFWAISSTPISRPTSVSSNTSS